MDPSAALELVREGSTLLLLDVPQFTVLGVDTQVFSVGPKFLGIKMVPPGVHFIYYCSPNREGNEFAPTTGFFVNTQPTQVVVRRWHMQEERLSKVSEDEEIRFTEAVKRMEFDDRLGPYKLDCYGDWKRLSSYVSPNVIERLEPIGGEISVTNESLLLDQMPKTTMEAQLMQQLRAGKFGNSEAFHSERGRCYYTVIPSSVKQKNISASDLTALNMDKTIMLECMLAKDYEGQEDMLLGELQFSFIAFLMGHSLEAFLQWKALISLLLSCTDAPLRTRTNLFSKFFRVIYFQLKHGLQNNQLSKAGDSMQSSLCLDESWFSKDTFLHRLCKDFFPLVLEAKPVDGNLLSSVRKLKTLLEDVLGWDFEDNAVNLLDEADDEFAPVIVQVDET